MFSFPIRLKRLGVALPWKSAHFRPLLVAGLLALASCGHPTPYQAASGGGKAQGYVDQALGEDRFRVTFAGNNRTPQTVVEDYLLYRAAELTLRNGFTYFRIVESDTLITAAKIPTYTEETAPYTGHRSTRYDVIRDGYFDRFGPSYSAGTTRERARFTATAVIEMKRGTKPDSDPASFDAQQLVDEIGPTLER